MKPFATLTPLLAGTSRLVLLSAILLAVPARAQINVLIDPAGDGGFENGATFASNGWTVSNSGNNPWVLGTAVGYAPFNNRSAYISLDGGATSTYDITTPCVNYFYRDVTVPAGQTTIVLSFDWRQWGEASWDIWQVFYAPTSVVPVGTTAYPGSGTSNVPAGIAGATFLANGVPITCNGVTPPGRTQLVVLPASLAGTTFRLIFAWKSDTSIGSNPPATIDNIALVSIAPGSAPMSGTFTIDNTLPTAGTNFNSFTHAFTHLALRGLSGPVTFNVTAGQVFNESTPGWVLPSTAANPVTVQRSGAGANPVLRPRGGCFTNDWGFQIAGGSFVTVDGIDVDGSFAVVPNDIEYGYYIRNVSATQGVQNNTVRNCKVTLNRTNTTTTSAGVMCTSSTTGGGVTPTAASGTASNNLFENITVENAVGGFHIVNGSTTEALLGVNNEVRNCTIGAAYTGIPPGDIGNPVGTVAPYGIQLNNQRDPIVRGNLIRNMASSTATNRGIYVLGGRGLTTISGNRILGMRSTSTTSTLGIQRGMDLTLSSLTTGGGPNTARVFNNFISDLTCAYTGVASSTRQLQGIFLAGTSSTNCIFEIDHNSVAIDGTGSTSSSICLDLNLTGSINRVRGNTFSNFTGPQTGVAKHYAMRTANASTLGAAGSVSNHNNFHVPFNGAGENGFMGMTSATDQQFLSNWQTAVSGADANSITADPLHFNNQTDLHTASAALYAAGPPGGLAWITTDIDGEPRPDPPSIGADEPEVCDSAPTAGAITGASSACHPSSVILTLTGSTTEIGVTRVWRYGTTPGGPYPNTLGSGFTQSTASLPVGQYYFVVEVECTLCSPTPCAPVLTPEFPFEVKPVPTASASNDGPACVGGSLQLSGTTDIGTTFQWTGPGGYSSTLEDPVINPVTVSSGGVYTFTATFNGCSSQATTTVVLNPVININSVTATPNPACGGNTALAVNASVGGTHSGGAITINAFGNATPYPSTINVSGVGTITSVKLTLNNITHTWADDVDIVLFGPTGAHSLIFADLFGSNDFTGQTYTFMAGGAPFTGSPVPPSGTYDVAGVASGYSGAGTPGPVTNVGLGVFNGTNADGVWSLYVFDDVGGDAGAIASWSLEFQSAAGLTYSWSPAAPLDNPFSATPNASGLTTATNFSVTVNSPTCSVSGNVLVQVGATLTASLVENCTSQTFNVNVVVVDDAGVSEVLVTYSVNGGTPVTVSAGITGVVLGPFAVTDFVRVSHNGGYSCNIPLGDFWSTCDVILDCNVTMFTPLYHCYGTNDTRTWTFVNPLGDPVDLVFLAGSQTHPTDQVSIWDGDVNDTEIYTLSGNLTGVYSSFGDMLSISISSPSGNNCQSGAFGPWSFYARCQSCQEPEAATNTVVDCPTLSYTVNVNLLSTGIDKFTGLPPATAGIRYVLNGGVPVELLGLSLGVHPLGPFPLGSTLSITLLHEDQVNQAICNNFLGSGFGVPYSACPQDEPCEAYLLPMNPNFTCTTTVPGNMSGATLTPDVPNSCTASGYTVASVAYAPVSPGGPTNPGPTLDDSFSGPHNLGFCFPFFGSTFTQVFIGSNGFLSFGSGSTALTPQTLPSATLPNNLIALTWRDLNPAAGGNIDWFTLTSPNRFVVRFNNVSWFGGGGSVTAQVILYEDGTIEMHNGSVPLNTYTQGIENATGTAAAVVPGRNNTPWSATNDAYRFTPAGPVQDVWFRFTATHPTHRVQLGGTVTGLFHSLYAGDCNEPDELTPIGCGCTAGSTPVTYTGLTPGNTYYVRVVRFTTGTNSFTACVSAPPTIDMGAVALVSPPAAGCYGPAETVTVRIQNLALFDNIDLAANPVTVNATATGGYSSSAVVSSGTLAPGATLDVPMPATIDMSAPLTYTFNASTSVAGDGNPANDAMPPATRTTTAPSTLPQCCNFQGPPVFNGTNLSTAHPGWREGTGPSVPAGTTSAWLQSTAGQTAFFGTTTARLTFSTVARDEWIVSPKFVATLGTRLSYKVARTSSGGTAAPTPVMNANDRLIVRISTDCGVSFFDIFTYDASNSSGITNALQTRYHDLFAYAGQEVIVGFYARDLSGADGTAYDFHLDDICIENLPVCNAPPIPGTASISNPGPVCSPASTTVSVTGHDTSGGIALQWYSSDSEFGVYTPIPGAVNPTYNATGLTQTTWFKLVLTCMATMETSETNKVSITVNPTPTASASWSGQCFGENLMLMGATDIGTVFSWTGPGGYSSTEQNPIRPSATPAMNGTYTFTATLGSCTSPPSSVVVTVQPDFTVVVSPPSASTCDPGDPVVLTASGADVLNSAGALVSGASPASNTGNTNPFYRFYGNVRRQYLYRASELSAAGLAGAIQQITFTCTSLPTTPPFNLNEYTIKLGHTTQTDLSVQYSGPMTTVYGPVNLTVALGAMNFPLSTPFTWDGVSNLVVEICHRNNADGSGCGSPICYSSGMGSLMASPGFTASRSLWSDTDLNACINPMTTVSPLRPVVTFTYNQFLPAQGYSWSPATGLNTTTGPVVTASPLVTTTYTVTGTSYFGCERQATVTVYVDEPLVASIAGPSEIEVCAGSSITLNGSAVGGGLPYTFTWSNGSGTIGTGPQLLNYFPAASETITLTVDDDCGNQATAQVNVTVKPTPTASASAGQACTTLDLQLTGTTDIGNVFSWSGPNGFTSTLQNPVVPNLTPAASGTYQFTAALNGCVSAPATVNVTVLQSPVISSVTASPAALCANGTSQLNAVVVPPALQLVLNGTGFWMDEVSWTLRNSLNVVIASGGPYGFNQVITVPIGPQPNGPFEFFIETQGFFGDNQTTYTLTCGPNVILTGTITPNQTFTQGGLLCDPAVTYAWSPATFLNNTTIPNPQAVNINTTTTYTVTVTGANGCAVQQPVTVVVDNAYVSVTLRTDMAAGQTLTYRVFDLAENELCTGSVTASGFAQITQNFNCCVPNGCYRLRVYDSGGDGVAYLQPGGYRLNVGGGTGARIIDNLSYFLTGATSWISGTQGGPDVWCLPVGTLQPIYTSCDKVDWKTGQYFVVSEDPAVSALWNPMAQPANTGYDIWIFNPNGGYSFVRARRHNASDGYANVGPTRTCHMKINNWAAANHVPNDGSMHNVRVRPVVAGVPGIFGPACRFAVNSAAADCPRTKLMDIPGHEFLSCGQTRQNVPTQRIHARPVTGAKRYQWRWRNDAEGVFVTRTTTTYFLNLGWPGNPLQPGYTYDVDVRISKFTSGDGDEFWCAPYADDHWGYGPRADEICTVTIVGGPMQGGGVNLAQDGSSEGAVSLWPNPNRGDQVWLSVEGVDAELNTVTVDLYDLAGKRVVTRVLPIQDGSLYMAMPLNGLAPGMYLVDIIAGEQQFTQRLVIAP